MSTSFFLHLAYHYRHLLSNARTSLFLAHDAIILTANFEIRLFLEQYSRYRTHTLWIRETERPLS